MKAHRAEQHGIGLARLRKKCRSCSRLEGGLVTGGLLVGGFPSSQARSSSRKACSFGDIHEGGSLTT